MNRSVIETTRCPVRAVVAAAIVTLTAAAAFTLSDTVSARSPRNPVKPAVAAPGDKPAIKAPAQGARSDSSADKVGQSQSTALPPEAERIFRAVVKVHARAVPNARSAATLGIEREGSGVVIGEDGLILTIGYLIVEADDVKITDSRGRSLPARIVGYDHATGFGLLRTVAPIDSAPLPLGDSAKVAERDPVMIVNSTGPDDVTLAYVVSRRAFTGSWEYMLDQAIFTSPPTLNWSGAALVDPGGNLLGLGSLIVRDALNGSQALPGNMFVPINTLKPVLEDLLKNGKRAGPPRPWLGVSADELQGRLLVTRVSPEGPGDAAGIQVGDIILGVGGEGVRTQAEFYRKVWDAGPAGTDIPLRILQGIDVKEVMIHSMDRVDYFRPQSTF